MGQQLYKPRGRIWSATTWAANSEKLWLPMLIDAMEKVGRPECRAIPCDRLVLAAVRTHLARPASAHGASRFNLRH
jgi:hypothetical protein